MSYIAFFLVMALGFAIWEWCFKLTSTDRLRMKNRLRDWWRTE
jgi:hypothetical protein